jgi:hypothetical protein
LLADGISRAQKQAERHIHQDKIAASLQNPCPSYRYRHFPARSPVLSSPIFRETRDHIEDWHDGFDWIFTMARLARTVVAGLPHHLTQRGNRREAIFFEGGDHEIYRDLLAEQTRKAGVEVWAYCLIPNHVHLILVPS